MPNIVVYLPDDLYSQWQLKFKGTDQGSKWFQAEFKNFCEGNEDISILKQKILQERFRKEEAARAEESLLQKLGRMEKQTEAKKELAVVNFKEEQDRKLHSEGAQFSIIRKTKERLTNWFGIKDETQLETLSLAYYELYKQEKPENSIDGSTKLMIKFASFNGLKFIKDFPFLKKYNLSHDLYTTQP